MAHAMKRPAGTNAKAKPSASVKRPAANVKAKPSGSQSKKAKAQPTTTTPVLHGITKEQLQTLSEADIKMLKNNLRRMSGMTTAGACTGSNITAYGHQVLSASLAELFPSKTFKFIDLYGCEMESRCM
jgi:hypothetical protein